MVMPYVVVFEKEKAMLYSFYIPGAKPDLEVKVDKEVLLNALDAMGISYKYNSNVVDIEDRSGFMRAVVFAAVRQFIKEPSTARDWLEIVRAMNDIEVLFWFTKIMYHRYSGYNGLRKVFKAVSALYLE